MKELQNSRRSFLKSLMTASAAGVVATGSTLASDRQSDDREKREIVEAARKLLRKSRTASNGKKAQQLKDTALSLLEQHEIGYGTEVGYPEVNDGGQFTTQDRYVSPGSNPNTEVIIDLYDYGSGVYTVDMSWELNEDSKLIQLDNTCPPDGAAIFWNNDKFQPVDVGRDNFSNTWTMSEGTSESGSVSYGDWDIQDGGVVAKVDDPTPKSADGENATFLGGYSIDLEAVSSDAGDYPIQVKYKHTYQYATGCTFSDFGVSIGFGVISITGGDVKSWSMPAQKSIDDAIYVGRY